MKKRNQMPTILKASISIVFLLVSLISCAQNNVVVVTKTPKIWQEDLDYLANEILLRHPNPFHYGPTPEVFQKALIQLKSEIPNYSDFRIAHEFRKFVGILNDAHTELRPGNKAWSKFSDPKWFPIKYTVGRDGIFVNTIDERHDNLVGAYLKSIDGKPISDIYEQILPYCPGDNILNRRMFVSGYLESPKALYEFGITKEESVFKAVFELADGSSKTITLESVSDKSKINWIGPNYSNESDIPIWRKKLDNQYWFEKVKGQSIVYCQFNACFDKKEQSFSDFCKEMFTYIEKNKIQKLIVDVRNNGGGDNNLSLPLIHGILRNEPLNKKGNIFFIIGRASRSATPSICVEAARHTNVLFVGEPTGGHPNGHGNSTRIVLPNSKLEYSCAGRFVRPSRFEDRRPWIAPDISAEVTAQYFLEDRDPSIEAIIGFEKLSSLSSSFTGMKSSNSDEIIKAIETFRGINENRWRDISIDLLILSEKLWEMKKKREAVSVLEYTVVEYPWSWIVHRELGKAYLKQNNKTKAIVSFRKAISLDSGDVSSYNALQRLLGDSGQLILEPYQ